MATTTPKRRRGTTLDKLVKKLGNISLNRIMTDPPPGTATEADVLAYLEAPRKRICELIDGVLVEKVMGLRESFFAINLAYWIKDFVRKHDLGLVAGADGTMRLFEGRVRIPDIAFVSWDRLPGRMIPVNPIPDLVPDLAIELLSPSNTAAEMERKRQDYFESGVRLVWEVNPVDRTVAVYTSQKRKSVLEHNDTLDGGRVLPGFKLKVSEIFTT